jgi:hypothetical protein
MSFTQLKDGSGAGYSAKVTSGLRLATESVIVKAENDAIRIGDGWQIASGPVSFTSATQSGILYVRNTDSQALILDRAVLILGTATGGTGDWTFQTIRNPGATGTLVTNAVTAGISNSNHGSAKIPNAEAYKGVQGDTVDTGAAGSGAPLPIQQASNRTVFPLGRRLEIGSSIAWRLTPPTGTTSATAVLVTHFYYDTSGL